MPGPLESPQQVLAVVIVVKTVAPGESKGTVGVQ